MLLGVDDLVRPLQEDDPQLYSIIKNERTRQFRGLEMIASENFTSRAVSDCLSSCLTNKYSGGMVGQRCCSGNKFIDEVETLCQNRALAAFGLSPTKWGVNVQPYCGSSANSGVCTALVGPHGRIMSFDPPEGGHPTNSSYTATEAFFETMPCKINPATGLINYNKLEEAARHFRPNMIIAGVSCYPRHLDYKRFRAICDQNGSLLLADVSHVGGLVAAKLTSDPFMYCDVVTTATHVTLRGPRSVVVFYRRGQKGVDKRGQPVYYDFEDKINQAVLPGLQGGPHNHQIAAVAVAMRQAALPAFTKYQQQVVKNAKALAKGLAEAGYKVVTGGTDNHLLWLDLKPAGLSGEKGEHVLEEVSIYVSKQTVPGDKSALNPGGLCLGTPALTSRGMKEDNMRKIVAFIDEALKLARDVQVKSGPAFVDFRQTLAINPGLRACCGDLRARVEEHATKYPLPGQPDL